MREISRGIDKKLYVNNKPEYQLERLHIYGEEHPETGLKQKVVGWSFSNKVKVIDPATGEKNDKPMKPFMVSQLQIAFERENLILSPYDEVLYLSLIHI